MITDKQRSDWIRWDLKESGSRYVDLGNVSPCGSGRIWQETRVASRNHVDSGVGRGLSRRQELQPGIAVMLVRCIVWTKVNKRASTAGNALEDTLTSGCNCATPWQRYRAVCLVCLLTLFYSLILWYRSTSSLWEDGVDWVTVNGYESTSLR